SFVKSFWALLELFKMVAFACAYEYFFADPLHRGLLSGPISRALGIDQRTGETYEKLSTAHEDLRAIREELKKFWREPKKYLATASEDFKEHIYKQLSSIKDALESRDPSLRFDTGVKIGEVLGDVLQLFIAVRAA